MASVEAKTMRRLLHVETLCIVVLIACETSAIGNNFYETFNLSLNLHNPIQTWTRTSEIQCASRCSLDATCTSFTWDSTDDTCTIGCCALATGGTRVANDSKKLFATDDTCRNDLGYELRSFNSIVRCLYLSREMATYDQAAMNCSDLGGRLCKANSVEIFEMITSMALEKGRSIYDRVYVGLDDKAFENTFVWSDGQAMTPEERSQLFRKDQPDNSNGEDCGEVTIYHTRLNDNKCHLLSSFVCEMDY